MQQYVLSQTSHGPPASGEQYRVGTIAAEPPYALGRGAEP